MTQLTLQECLEWQGIASAPKDGTHLLLRNPHMEKPVIGKFGDYYSDITRKTSKQWVVLKDHLERFMPIRPGTMMCPTEWMSLTQVEASGLIGEAK